jgi:hypothetical protein
MKETATYINAKSIGSKGNTDAGPFISERKDSDILKKSSAVVQSGPTKHT